MSGGRRHGANKKITSLDKIFLKIRLVDIAQVVESAYTADLKSANLMIMRVQVPL